MKTKLTWLISLAVIGGVAWDLISTHLATVKQQQAAEKAVETKQQQKDAGLAVLALKYNAVTNWEASLPDRGLYSFSIDVSRALIQSNGQPVLIIMSLVDVEENSNSYTASFSKDVITTNGTFQLYVYLKCTQEQANQLLKIPNSDFSKTYAVVVRLDGVERPRIRLHGSGEGEDSRIDIDTSTDIFFAFGKLLGAISLP
jgi:hypothetical protein